MFKKTRRQWRSNRRQCVDLIQAAVYNDHTVRVQTAWVNCLLEVDLYQSVEDPNLRLGNADMMHAAGEEMSDEFHKMVSKRSLEQSNLRCGSLMLSTENGGLEDFCTVRFPAWKLITGVQNTGKMGAMLPQQQRNDMGDFMVGDPLALCLHLVEEDVTVM